MARVKQTARSRSTARPGMARTKQTARSTGGKAPLKDPLPESSASASDAESDASSTSDACLKWIRVDMACKGCSLQELDIAEEAASPRALLTLTSLGGEQKKAAAAAGILNLDMSLSEPDLLRHVVSSMIWVEDRIQQGELVFLLMCPLSTAWLAAWMIRQMDAARTSMPKPQVQKALEWASDIMKGHGDEDDGAMSDLNASMIHQLEMLRAGISTARFITSSVVALPSMLPRSSLAYYTPRSKSTLPTFPSSCSLF